MQKEILRTDWLKLETSVEVIGDMIAHNCAKLYRLMHENPVNHEAILKVECELDRLGVERHQCYVTGENESIIDKAHFVYAPFLKSLSQFL